MFISKLSIYLSRLQFIHRSPLSSQTSVWNTKVSPDLPDPLIILIQQIYVSMVYYDVLRFENFIKESGCILDVVDVI